MSARLFVLSTLSALAALPSGALAQERQPFPRARVYIDRGDGPEAIRDRIQNITQRRARLGVTVQVPASANDSIGATIQSVTPGGPAAKVGIRSGDVISRINGKLLTAKDNTRADEDESLPAVRLIEFVSELKPGDTVAVEYSRAGARKTVSVITSKEPMIVMREFPDGNEFTWEIPGGAGGFSRLPRMGADAGSMFKVGPDGGFGFAFGMPLMDVDLAPLNADLGAYFGTTEGVLVINTPKESTLGLKGGDVILSLDGRKVSNPGSFYRILRSYDPGDSFKIEIMRNKARTTVTGSLNKDREE